MGIRPMVHRASITLFVLCWIVLGLSIMWVVAPYTYDSAELAVGAYTLGLVHGPGYPLYLVLAHLFTHLPFGSILDRVSFFSILCLALTAPLTYHTLARCGLRRSAAAVATLTVLCLYPLWAMAVIPEVYTPQMFSLALAGYAFSRYHARPNGHTLRATALAGGSCGLALGIHPGSILFFPAVLVALVAMKIPRLHLAIFNVTLALIFGAALLYFPIRYSAHPALNMLGTYDSAGVFHAVDLTRLDGILWTISGQQFGSLFFAEGLVPTPARLAQTLQMLASQLNVLPSAATLVGLAYMSAARRRLLALWLLLFVPFFYFYSAYGAVDRETMFGPAYLLLSLPIAFGLHWALEILPKPVGRLAVTGAPLMVFVTTVVSLISQSESSRIQRANELDCLLPEDAIVFADWRDATVLQYQQLVQGQYPNVTAYNLFLFDEEALRSFLRTAELYQSNRPIVMLSPAATRYLNDQFPSAIPLSCVSSQRSSSSDASLSFRGFVLARRTA